MTEFAEKIRGRFHRRGEARKQRLAAAESEVRDIEPLRKQWPALRSLITVYALPKLQSWIKDLRAAIQPAQVKRLGGSLKRLERLVGITWWHPRGIYVRLRAAIYGLGILLISAFWLAVVTGVVVLLFYLVLKLVKLMQAVLMWLS